MLKPGLLRIGRDDSNDIIMGDNMISRNHAELHVDSSGHHITITDLGSTNGTYVNHHLLPPSKPFLLRIDDSLRIGFFEMHIGMKPDDAQPDIASESLCITDATILESLDQHAILLYEIINKLNTVFNIQTALDEIATLMQRSLGVEKCGIFLPNQFKDFTGLNFPTTYAIRAIQQREAIFIPKFTVNNGDEISQSAKILQIHSLLCVPAISNEQVLGLIYLYNTTANKRVLDKNDLYMAVAVAHLAALTLERVNLCEKIQEQERVHQLIKRFLPPSDAYRILDGYLKTGYLPEISEQTATILFADIADSTHLAEKLGPKRFGAILNRYYQDMTNIVFTYGGMIDKYLGDGVMAVFGISDKQTNIEKQAVQAGLQMLERLEKHYGNEGSPITIGVSVNTGQVMAGYVVTQERVELTVLGDTVNVAARLEAMARPNRLLVGPLTHHAIQGYFRTKGVGLVTIRGRNEPPRIVEGRLFYFILYPLL